MSVPALLTALLLTFSPAAAFAAADGGDSPGDRAGAREQAERIESRLNASDSEGAVAVGEAAVRIYPKDSCLWFALGKAYGERARTAPLVRRLRFARKCKAAFEKSVELDAGNVEARLALFRYYFEAPGVAGGSLSLARRQAEEIVKLDPARGRVALDALAEHEAVSSRP